MEHAVDNGRRWILPLTLACLLALADVAVARPCAPVPIDYAFSRADLIVKGSVVSTIHSHIPEGDSRSEIRIERVLKGSRSLKTVSVSHFLCGWENGYAFSVGRHVIVFIDTAGGTLVNGTAVWPASVRSASPHADPRLALDAELRLSLRDRDPQVARSAVGALAELEGHAAVGTLKQYADTKDFGTRFRALTWLTRFGDADAFEEVARIVSGARFTNTFPGGVYDGESLGIAQEDLRVALRSFSEKAFERSTLPPNAGTPFVKTMIRLAAIENPAIHRGAISALRGFKHRAAFPALDAALDDPDRYVRYDAMLTLCSAMNVHGVGCPATAEFERNEQTYITRVRTWWRRQQR